MKFIDEIYNNPMIIEEQNIIRTINQSIRIDAQNVSRFYFDSEKDYWDIIQDIPFVKLPFDNSTIYIGSHTLENPENEIITTEKLCNVEYVENNEFDDLIDFECKKIKFICFNKVTVNDRFYTMLWNYLLLVDNNGNVIKANDGGLKCLSGKVLIIDATNDNLKDYLQNYFNNYSPADIRQMFWDNLFCSLLTIAFMNCKNGIVKEKDPNKDLPTRITKHWEKKGKEPLKKYYTLNIEPMKQILKTEGNIDQNGLNKALHICRGHFRTYDDKGLFGKYKGTFWIPQHIKGNAIEGEIIKDYNIKL